MHLGLMIERDRRQGRTQREASDEAFALAETPESVLQSIRLFGREVTPQLRASVG
jgi:hypothetical protein